jgi:hypothetical protein
MMTGMRRLKLFFLFCLLFFSSIIFPLKAQASDSILTSQLRAAIDSLTTPFDVQIYEPDFDINHFSETFDFTGVEEWSYEGRTFSNNVSMVWDFKWDEVHAVLAAFKSPALENRLDRRHQDVLEKCRAILNKYVTAVMTDYEIEKLIHDYLCSTVKYDSETADSKDTSNRTPFTAYGALIEGTAVCQGYVNAAVILLTMAGIENYALDSETHTWNLVRLGNDYYHMDITWDSYESERLGSIQHSYFNLTDEQMLRYSEHEVLDAYKYPTASGTAYHYYGQYRRVAYNLEDIKWFVTQANEKNEKSVTIWVDDQRTYPYDWENDLRFISKFSRNGKPINKYTVVKPGPDRDTLTVIFD